MAQSDLITDGTPGTPPDPWLYLRRYTKARIALGRTGGSQPTAAVLKFRLAHARARDAVGATFAPERFVAALATAGIDSRILNSCAKDRGAYLRRPDLGRMLDQSSRDSLQQGFDSHVPPDLALIVSDGLAPAGVERHAIPTLASLLGVLAPFGWRATPVFVVPFARVKLQDEIGALLKARYSLILLGERPGLGVPDSLGAYFTAAPAPERTDADRNCISNIRMEGLPPVDAGGRLARLLLESARTGTSGVRLKDNEPIALRGSADQ